jgi:hypothetical protein
MRVYVPCAILSGLGFWLVSGFGQFLSGLAPGRFAKIRKFCPDRDQTVCAIDRGPVDRHSASPYIIVSHSYMLSLARCPSAPQRPAVLCGCKLMLCSSTETWAVTMGCYRGASTFYPALLGS